MSHRIKRFFLVLSFVPVWYLVSTLGAIAYDTWDDTHGALKNRREIVDASQVRYFPVLAFGQKTVGADSVGHIIPLLAVDAFKKEFPVHSFLVPDSLTQEQLKEAVLAGERLLEKLQVRDALPYSNVKYAVEESQDNSQIVSVRVHTSDADPRALHLWYRAMHDSVEPLFVYSRAPFLVLIFIIPLSFPFVLAIYIYLWRRMKRNTVQAT